MLMFGFVTTDGFVGRMPDGHLRLFATENDYVEAFDETIGEHREAEVPIYAPSK